MRQAAQAKMGFYALPPEIIPLIAARLKADKPATILDPCAGEGEALALLAEALNCRPTDVYAVELDEARSRALKQRLPQARVLAPCSFFGTTASRKVFSVVYCNPPFDDGIGGGGRVEHDFIRRATELLQPGGVIVIVCPEHVADHWKFGQLLGTWYNHASRFEFPPEYRRFGEVVVIAVKRDKASAGDLEFGPDRVYDLPPARTVALWAKTMLTDAELLAALAQSPLRKLLAAPPEDRLPEPPLALGQGHVALLLASGHLDGIVRPANEPPHVVRGVCSKQQYVASSEESEAPDGRRTEKTILKERPILTVRVLSADGTIETLSQQESSDAEAVDSE